ncbi:MAG TPA: hypothetical protein PKL77_10505 [Candidatus Omnitrophota bacterium]|jgi:hypothetical protein|nr:hypothetical protein [Candidatus Omnitrophota bacterium]HPS19739.1 hypothetical protein [Candidatus Omnitrophota bacterium]
MAKKLIPCKVVLEFDNGDFLNGVILYKVNDSGVISRVKSIGIKDADFNKQTLNGVLKKFIKHASQAEGAQDE